MVHLWVVHLDKYYNIRAPLLH